MLGEKCYEEDGSQVRRWGAAGRGGGGAVLDAVGGVGASLRSRHLSRDLNKVKDKGCGYQAGEQQEERP